MLLLFAKRSGTIRDVDAALNSTSGGRAGFTITRWELVAAAAGKGEAKSLVPKSVTTAVALGIIEEGALSKAPQDQLIEPLLSVGIMISALSGAVLGPLVLRLAGVHDRRAIGLALGIPPL